MAVRVQNVLSLLLICSFFCLALSLPGAAHAQRKVTKLTKQNVTNFILKTADITSGKDENMSSEDIKDYLERHLDKGARFKSTMKYNMPGQPSQENTMSLNKKDFIDSIEEGQKSVSDYETEIEVKKVSIARNGRKATVKTVGQETAIMPVSFDGVSTKEIPVQGRSTCNQIISLSKKNIIQMFSAQCTTEIEFLAFE